MNPAMALSSELDASPVLVRSAGVFTQAEQERERIFRFAEGFLRQQGVRALTLQSSQNIHPCWVKVECWLPRGDRMVTDRCSVTIAIVPAPFHRFELLYTITLVDREKSKVYPAMNRLGEEDLSEILLFLLRKRGKPSLSHLMLRRFGWELWKPKNKLDILARDWFGGAPGILIVVAS